MKEFKNMKVKELSKTEKVNTSGGWGLGSVIFAGVMFSIFSVWEYPEEFEAGTNETFESSL